jgi:hypothetical protein
VADPNALLAQIRKVTGWATTSPDACGSSTAHQTLETIAELFAGLDSHLAAGGTPPTAWAEGPDAPELDNDPGAGLTIAVDEQGRVIRASITPTPNTWTPERDFAWTGIPDLDEAELAAWNRDRTDDLPPVGLAVIAHWSNVHQGVNVEIDAPEGLPLTVHVNDHVAVNLVVGTVDRQAYAELDDEDCEHDDIEDGVCVDCGANAECEQCGRPDDRHDGSRRVEEIEADAQGGTMRLCDECVAYNLSRCM